MNPSLRRAAVAEMLGAFALVYFGAGAVCVNQMTLPAAQDAGSTALLGQHPGLVGIALAQGFILAAALAVTVPISGGYLNPAVTITLWVFNRLDSLRATWLLGAQLVGAVLGGLCLRFTFSDAVLQAARLGTPHLNPLAYPAARAGAEASAGQWWGTLAAGIAVEVVLTFFLVFAIFGTVLRRFAAPTEGDRPGKKGADVAERGDARLGSVIAGLTMAACALFGQPLTGAAVNPARWFGTAVWEWALGAAAEARTPGAFADMFVYIAGPILGALAAGLAYFRVTATERA